MNDTYAPTQERRTPDGKLVIPLAERMDAALGETTAVMGAMITELVRRTLRQGVIQVGEELSSYAAEKVDESVLERMPAIEQAAVDVADVTARRAATEIAHEECTLLEKKARESDEHLAAQIQETARSAQQTAEITARELEGKIGEAEKRANETAHSEIVEQVDSLRERYRKGTALVMDMLKAHEERADGICRQLVEEQTDRKNEATAHKAELRALEESQSRLRHALEDLRKSHQELRGELEGVRAELDALAARTAHLEKPRGLRWLAGKLMFWRKK
jgi:chromosome segregation ATPase